LLLVIASTLYLALAVPSAQAAEEVKINRVAPDFTLPNLGGKEVSLSSLRGRVVILTFWSVWCHACREEMGVLDSVYQKYKDKGLEVIGVNIDPGGSTSVEDYVKKHSLSFPMLRDTEKKVMRAYRANFLPSTFLLDKKGIVVDKVVGLRNWNSPEYQGLIEKVMKK
jgi:peroxiredoxin